MARLGRAQPNTPIIARSTLQDPPVLTAPAPIVVEGWAGRRGVPNEALIIRASLEVGAEPEQATPAPLVVAAPRPARASPSPIVLRASLQDPPVLTTPLPVVVSRPRKPAPGFVLVDRGPVADNTAPPASTPTAVVVAAPTKRQLLAPPIVIRATLADPTVETTPAPMVVTSSTRPQVVPAVISRASLIDPPPAVATPAPLLVTAAPTIRVGRIIIGRAPMEQTEDPCTITRPNTGLISRPNTGMIIQPC